jgi:hypothetical protein
MQRRPTSFAASATCCGWKYISAEVVIPPDTSVAAPSSIAHRTSSGVSRPSRGHMTSVSQRSTGNPSPAPRSNTIGLWAWALTKPGSRIP